MQLQRYSLVYFYNGRSLYNVNKYVKNISHIAIIDTLILFIRIMNKKTLWYNNSIIPLKKRNLQDIY